MAPSCSDRPVWVVARVVIARLQRDVQAWADADQVLPAAASSLLATLAQVQQGLHERAGATVRCGMETFRAEVNALIDARILAPGDGSAAIETAAAMGALLTADSTADDFEPAMPSGSTRAT